MTLGRYSLLAFAAGAVCAALPVKASTVFTDRDTFSAQNTVVITETFDQAIMRAPSITFGSGVTATASTPDVPLTQNEVSNGSYVGFVRRDGFRDITFDFGMPISGFGADFTSGLSNTSLMVTGRFDGMSETVSIADAVGQQGFFGLTSTTAFQSVSFRTNAGAFLFGAPTPFGGESFQVDNLTALDDAGVAPIPLPATGFLLIAGLGGLGALRRRTA